MPGDSYTDLDWKTTRRLGVARSDPRAGVGVRGALSRRTSRRCASCINGQTGHDRRQGAAVAGGSHRDRGRSLALAAIVGTSTVRHDEVRTLIDACAALRAPLEEGDLRCAVCALPVPGRRRAVATSARPDPALHRVRCRRRVRPEHAGAGLRVLRRDDDDRAARRSDRGRASCACRSRLIAKPRRRALRAWLAERGFFAPHDAVATRPCSSRSRRCAGPAGSSTRARRSRGPPTPTRARAAPSGHRMPASCRSAFDDIVVPASRGLIERESELLVAVLRPRADPRPRLGCPRCGSRASMRNARRRARWSSTRSKSEREGARSRSDIPGRAVSATSTSSCLRREPDDRSHRAAGVGARVSLSRLAVSRDRPRPAPRSCSASRRSTGARSRAWRQWCSRSPPRSRRSSATGARAAPCRPRRCRSGPRSRAYRPRARRPARPGPGPSSSAARRPTRLAPSTRASSPRRAPAACTPRRSAAPRSRSAARTFATRYTRRGCASRSRRIEHENSSAVPGSPPPAGATVNASPIFLTPRR